ncbi:MAG: hypothetical protein COB51_08030 [Moraxellaceae bacterium]|nr:MAG: hypothetical protein COB51_08030 [Moraxellaceae bacterium]
MAPTCQKLSFFYLLLLCSSICSSADVPQIPQYYVKAAFLIELVDFVKWPNDTSDHSGENKKTICVFGENPFHDYLEKFSAIENNNIAIHYFQNLEKIPHCHILFISRSEKHSLSKILRVLKNKIVLTVSDIRNFAHEKGMIEFVIRSRKVRLRIDLATINESGIKLSSNLIELAMLVNDDDKYNKKKGRQ